MASNSKRSRDDKTKFTEAEKNWNLEKLYEDLKAAKQRCGSGKRKVLTETEKCYLRGLLCGCSDKEIANERGVVVGTVNDALSKTLYCYIEELLDYKKKIRHWGDVPDFFEQAGYKIQISEQSQLSHSLPNEKENTVEKSHNIEANLIREWRFKSVDQLWSKDIGERISGIRKLERIAKDYPTEHWAIMEELAEFIRIKAPRQEGEEERSPEISEDIQAALTVIGQRDPNKDLPNLMFDLSNTYLREADFTKANLQGANLSRANLQGAKLSGANLQGANMINADLQDAFLCAANLQGANLTGAKLQGAKLPGANLKALLRAANLQRANLIEADMEEAVLREVNLEGALLQRGNLQRVFLQGAKLNFADLAGADVRGADLSEAEGLNSWQIRSVHGNSTTILPLNVERPEHWS